MMVIPEKKCILIYRLDAKNNNLPVYRLAIITGLLYWKSPSLIIQLHFKLLEHINRFIQCWRNRGMYVCMWVCICVYVCVSICVYVCVSVYETLYDILLVHTVHLRRTAKRLRRIIVNTFRSRQGRDIVFSRKMFLVESQPPHNLHDSWFRCFYSSVSRILSFPSKSFRLCGLVHGHG